MKLADISRCSNETEIDQVVLGIPSYSYTVLVWFFFFILIILIHIILF